MLRESFKKIKENYFRKNKILTLFSICHGFVMAAKSQTVIVMARSSSRCSSNSHRYALEVTKLKKTPRFLRERRKQASL